MSTLSDPTVPHQLRALGLLLDYPGDALQTHLDELRAVLAALEPPRPGGHDSLQRFIDHLAAGDLLDLQAEYVDTFDRGRSTSLNLFEHVHGDSRDRGQAMVDLLAQYQQAGLQLHARQLPDYLPVYLEYCSVLDTGAAREALEEVALLVAHLTAALERRESPWAAATAAVCRLTGLSDWRAHLAQQAAAESAAQHAAATPADWTAAALDAAWAEEPVNFLGVCTPQTAPAGVQPVHFARRATPSPSAGV